MGGPGDGRDEVCGTPVVQIYDELRRIASKQLRSERAGHTLQTTALVHEAYLKLVNTSQMTAESRLHFCAVASQAIRRILVDHARAKNRQKRGGGARAQPLASDPPASDGLSTADLVALDDALQHLARVSERQSRIVEMKFFGGMTMGEIAELLDVSERTAHADWSMARAWLRRELGGDER